MPNKKQLLVYGFIREIENILSNNTIIPLGLIEICCTFYIISLRLFLTATNQPKIRIADIQNQSVSNLKFDTASIQTIKSFQSQSRHARDHGMEQIQAPCYIPDISSYIQMDNKNKCYDGIVGVFTPRCRRTGYVYCVPCIVLFEANTIDNENINCHFHAAADNIPDFYKHFLTIYMDMIYINSKSKQSVVYKDWKNIYELDLNKVDISSGQWNFNFLTEMPLYSSSHTDMAYINESKIFATTATSENYGPRLKTQIHRQLKCSIFDMETKKWTSGKELSCKLYLNYHSLELAICKNNVYDINIVYGVSNYGHTARFDLQKNDWEMIWEDDLMEKMIFDKKPMVWMEDNPYILYCYSKLHFTCKPDGMYPYCFGHLDVRDNNARWIKHNDMDFLYSNKSFTQLKRLKAFL